MRVAYSVCAIGGQADCEVKWRDLAGIHLEAISAIFKKHGQADVP